jgi:hypothetical protein
MSDSRRPASPSRGLWMLICVILAPAVIVPLWVGLYDKDDPRLGGWPFFFWFQMALIPATTVVTVIAFMLSKAADRQDRSWRADTAGRRTDATR